MVLHGLRRVGLLVLSGIRHTGAAHKHTVGVNGIGCAGDQRAVVPAGDNFQILGVFRLHDLDLVYLIRQHLVHDVEVKAVALAQLVQVGKQYRLGQTAVPRQHTVGACAAQRIAGAFQMSDALYQHIVACALINGQVYVNFGYGNVAKALAHVQHVHIACADVVRFARRVAVDGIVQLLVVAARSLLGGVDFLGVHRLHVVVVAFNDRACVALCHRVADNRVHGHADAGDDHQRSKTKF